MNYPICCHGNTTGATPQAQLDGCHARVKDLEIEIARLEKEHEEMANNQCLYPDALYLDDGGTPHCRHERENHVHNE